MLAALSIAISLAIAHAEGDPADGEQVFRDCMACHQIGADASHAMGPHLNDLFGRPAGGAEGFDYSPAMAEAGATGLVWSEDTLAEHLRDTRGFIPGNRMGFAGLRSEQQIADVIAYLKQFAD